MEQLSLFEKPKKLSYTIDHSQVGPAGKSINKKTYYYEKEYTISCDNCGGNVVYPNKFCSLLCQQDREILLNQLKNGTHKRSSKKDFK